MERLLDFLEFFPPSEPYVIGDFLNWSEGFRNAAKDYSSWASGGAGMALSYAAVWQYSKLINEHAPTVAFQNHDIWLHLLYGRSPQTMLRVHCPGFHHFGFWHLVPFSQPWLSTKHHNTGYSGALERIGPHSKTIVSLHFCRDLGALENFHQLVQDGPEEY